jgi:plastocyanin
MISAWRTCFSLLALVQLSGATISGVVQLSDSGDSRRGKKPDNSGVVIWLEPLSGGHPALPHLRATMLQKNKTFKPHVLAIPAGSTVDFPNHDPIFHNAFSNYDGQIFDVGLYSPGSSRSVRFTRPGMVRVFCNIHANMSAIIAVLDTPWFAVTDKDGVFTIPDVPAGEYSVNVFHERATAATLKSLTQRITVDDGAVALEPIRISETGYLAIPHKNKYGRDYPPAPDETGAYPTARP